MTSPGEALPRARPQHSRRGLVVGILLCVVATAFEAMAVLTAMPAAAADLGGHDFYAWTFTGFVIAQTFSIVAAGRACDSFGPVRPLMVGFGLFTLGVVLAALAPTMLLLVLARVVQGLGGGTMNLAVMVLVGLAFDGRERALLMTWFSFAWMGPAFVGPPIAAWLSEQFSWHWVFWSVLPLLAVAGVLVLPPLLRLPLPAPHGTTGDTRRALGWA
ncbi:MAG: MFS transporter, partial [Propionicimonas sp.]